MQYIMMIAVAFLASTTVNAEELERSTITSCAYQAGTAREIQTIRQTEGDDWAEFEKKVLDIYAESQGRSDLLVIAKRVYLQPTEVAPDEVYEYIFSACAKRINGEEEVY